MPPERHSSPPPRPPRDRHTGGGFAGPRRNFGGGGFSGGGPRDGGPRPPFTPRPAPAPVEPSQSVRLREGDREAEIHGSAAFVRQTLDDLPALFARLRGEAVAPTRPASISLPKPPRTAPAAEEDDEFDDELADDEDEDEEDEEPPARHRERHRAAPAPAKANGRGARSLEDRIFRTLERADHPLSVAAIRKQIGADTTGQQIRRILERASDRVVATTERPAAYALR
jgi:hypothetical protein